MTASLAIYHVGTRVLEPLAPWIVEQRLKSGKERPERISETKPDYVLILPSNLRDEIAAQMAVIREWGGQFLVPIPRN